MKNLLYVALALIVSIFLLFSCKGKRFNKQFPGSTFELESAERIIYRTDSTPLVYNNQFNHFNMVFLEDVGPADDNFILSYDTKDHYGFQYTSILEVMIEHLNFSLEDSNQHEIESGSLQFYVSYWDGNGKRPHLNFHEAGVGDVVIHEVDDETMTFKFNLGKTIHADSTVETFTMRKLN